ncbi:MAG: glycosyltransferase family 2 protein [Alphaproteobacteria bacterium]|nr:glycosyltransferase family 2 protein [Alphaproteobacteria bacterium]
MSRDVAVIVGYNVAATVGAVVEAIPEGLPVFFVDDGSTDAPVVPERVRVLRHPRNRGYGAAQKTGYAAAIAEGYERVALVHGDGQYRVEDVLALLEALDEAEVALGSRFLTADRGAIIPWWRRWANRGLTELANLRLGRRFTELHTGARAYRCAALAELDLVGFSEDYVFDQQVLIRLARRGARFAERPVRVRYDDEVQSISFRRSVRYGLGCVRVILSR